MQFCRVVIAKATLSLITFLDAIFLRVFFFLKAPEKLVALLLLLNCFQLKKSDIFSFNLEVWGLGSDARG